MQRRTSGGERIGARNFHNFSRGDNNRVLLEPRPNPGEEQCSNSQVAPKNRRILLSPSPSFSLLLAFTPRLPHLLHLLCVFRCNPPFSAASATAPFIPQTEKYIRLCNSKSNLRIYIIELESTLSSAAVYLYLRLFRDITKSL